MAEAEKIQSILHGECRMTSTFASSQLSYTSFLLLLCELFTDVTAMPPGSQPGAHMARSVFAVTTHVRCGVCQGGFLPSPSLSLFLDAPLPCTCIGFISLQKLLCLQPGASELLPDLLCDSALSRPAGSQEPALPLPTS